MTLPTTRSILAQETRLFPLEEGTDLLVRPTTSNDIVAVELIFPMGSREEAPGEAGISTLALRMLTRGTKGKSDFEIAVALESIGASLSADAQKDRASVSLQTTVENLFPALDLLEEILTEATFPEDWFEIEKEILINEIREDLDSPFTATARLFQETLYAGHPYAHPAGGAEETVERLEHARVRDWFRERFNRRGLTLAAVGRLDLEELVPRIQALVRSLPKPEEAVFVARQKPAPLAAPSQFQEVYKVRSTEAECMIYGFPAPPFRHPDFAPLKVMDSIMGGSMDSRLFSEIREKQGLVYQIGSNYSALEWQGTFAVSLMTTVQNHDRILETLSQEIGRIKETVPEEDEVQRSKTYLQGTFLMSQEKSADQASLLARYHSIGAGVEFIDLFPRLLAEVDLGQIQEVARKYLTQPTLAIVGPGPQTQA